MRVPETSATHELPEPDPVPIVTTTITRIATSSSPTIQTSVHPGVSRAFTSHLPLDRASSYIAALQEKTPVPLPLTFIHGVFVWRQYAAQSWNFPCRQRRTND